MEMRTRLPESAMRWPQAPPRDPPNTTEWITPSRAQASIVIGSSGTSGMWTVTRSPFLRPQKSRRSAANSFTRLCSSWYVRTMSGSFSSSGTKMYAALSLLLGRCRSRQLKLALIFPPTNHFQNGGLLESSVLSHFLYQESISAYSSKHFGNLSRAKRSRTLGSLRFACSMNFFGGWKQPSFFQWTAIWASVRSRLLMKMAPFAAGGNHKTKRCEGRLQPAHDRLKPVHTHSQWTTAA